MTKGILILTIVFLVPLPTTAEEKPDRGLEAALRAAADALIKADWSAYEATLVTADGVRGMEAAFVKAGDADEYAKPFADLRDYIARNGDYRGAAARQRADAVEYAKIARAAVVAGLDWSKVRWSRHLPIRTHVIRARPFEVREESFALGAEHRERVFELVFSCHAMRLDSAWTFMTGVQYGGVIEKPVAAPDATTHPFAGLWTGIEGKAPHRDVTLWLQPLEEESTYRGRALITRKTPKGTSVSSAYMKGIKTGATAEGPTLGWSGGFLLLQGDTLQGRFTIDPVALRRVALDKPPKAIARKIKAAFRGVAAVHAPELATVRQSAFDLDMKTRGKDAIAVKLRSGEGGDPRVAGRLRITLTARHTEASIVSVPGKTPFFEFVRLRHAALFRLVWCRGDRFGPMPAIVHGYAPFE